MAKNINFNDKNYPIDESILASATTSLQSHLSTVMNGTGAIIEFGGTEYSVDSTKLSEAMNSFVAHLGTIAGEGTKIVVGGVEYSIDSTKLTGAISELEAVLGGIGDGSLDESEPNVDHFLSIEGCPIKFGTPYTSTDAGYAISLILYTDGRADIWTNGYLHDSYPVGTLIYDKCDILVQDAVIGTVNEDGTTLTYQGVLYTLDTSWCPHGDSILKNVTELYTGDEYCVYCGDVIQKGECKHVHTERRDNTEYFYDDLYCLDCKSDVAYILPEGATVYKGVGQTDVGDYTGASAIYTAGDTVINEATGDVLVYGDYEYRHNMHYDWQTSLWVVGTDNVSGIVWCPRVIDKSKTSYETTLDALRDRDSIRTIQGTYTGCENLESVTLSNGLDTIGESAFSLCKNLKSITIPENVIWIRESAFHKCTSLPSITIPDSVRYIEAFAFGQCTALTSITFNGTIAQWNAITKESKWNYLVPATHVHCSDGDVELTQE